MVVSQKMTNFAVENSLSTIHTIMRKNILPVCVFAAASVFLMSFAACTMSVLKQETVIASDVNITKEVKLNDFKEINTVGSHNLVFIQEKEGEQPRVVIDGPDNVVALMEVEQDGDGVRIGLKEGYNVDLGNKDLVVTVYSKELRGLTLTGSGNAAIKDGLATDGLSLSVTGSGRIIAPNIHCDGEVTTSVTGSGKIDAAAESKHITGSVTGSGTLSLKGVTDEATFTVTGSGNIEATGLKAGKVNQSTTGSGSINL